MSVYEVIKDCISTAQKADNIPLVQTLIEAQKQILDLLNENYNLKEENRTLKENKTNKDNIERHEDAFITLKNDSKKIIYCSCCYDKDGKLVQAQAEPKDGRYWCPACKYIGYFDKKKYDMKYHSDEEENNYII